MNAVRAPSPTAVTKPTTWAVVEYGHDRDLGPMQMREVHLRAWRRRPTLKETAAQLVGGESRYVFAVFDHSRGSPRGWLVWAKSRRRRSPEPCSPTSEVVVFLGIGGEFVAEVGVSDRDQPPGPFAQALAE